MTNMLILNVPPAGVTYPRTRSEKAAERATICLTWHSRVFPFVIPGSSFCGRGREQGKLLLSGVSGWLALHTDSSCRFHVMKSFHLSLILLKHCRAKFWSLSSGQTLGEEVALSSSLSSLSAKLERPHTATEWLEWHRRGGQSRQGPGSLSPSILR